MPSSFDIIRCCRLGFDMAGCNRRVRLRNPLREICTVGSGGRRHPDGAMVNLNGHEAGNGGHSQGKTTAYRDSSTRREAIYQQLARLRLGAQP